MNRPAFLLQAVRRPGQPARFGVTVTRKVGNAVERNRIRRRLRAAVASAAVSTAGADYVLVARRGALTRAFTDLVTDLAGALATAERRLADSGGGKETA